MPYEMPPKALADVIDAPLTPGISLDPSHTYLLLMHRPGYPPIEDVARPELRLAGLRIDPKNNGQSRVSHYDGLTLKRVDNGHEEDVKGLPDGARIGQGHWSPDGSHFAFSVTGATGIALWICEVATGVARPIDGIALNCIWGTPLVWLPDSSGLMVRTISDDRGALPEVSTIPDGPVIQENIAQTAPSRTYQDLLKNAHDEATFEYYCMTQVVCAGLDGTIEKLGMPDLICRSEPSPDGQFLLVETMHRPFSYLVPSYRFPVRVEIWDRSGNVVHELFDLPLAESVPIAFDAVPDGPRGFGWRADVLATVTWVTAQDGGDPSVDVEVRDKMFALCAPFDAEPVEVMALSMRYVGRSWGSGNLALVSERWWKTRRVRTWQISPDGKTEPKVLFDRSWEDRYNDPGMPLLKRNAAGRRVLQTDEDERCLFLVGDGASPEGDRPFLDRYDLNTQESTRLMHSEPPFYERPVAMLDVQRQIVLMGRESVQEPTNYFLRDLSGDDLKQVTNFTHPLPHLKDVQKELIIYQREDGVQLTGTLYLPPGYKTEDGPLPLVMWAYPREFKSADAAGQVKDSPHRFVRVSPLSPLPLLASGYAVLDGPTMPIIGEGDQEANDTYVEQLTASAKAAVDEVVRRGVADPKRICVGGHSYGAFMTANLLAHTDLFCCGIARSGAYNRTLTPFGFQAEERSIWEAPEVYTAMSPFMHADKIKAPLLMMHGEADNNSGTFPMQSERFYNALKGHGVTCRLVMLPHESHGYRARESLMQMLWEMVTWLDQYAKGE
ncbi:MAG: S9 family peptidase [Candidatus Latescibacteria bacterium]|jgi:dipeptidyl aminopeptidase/acylaminoacyl peptidase|nr:S9 family peptidase [Candidatus Latescibacterota bacterium]MBT5830653.1 S9 family peptidase [Candidatus Latescibacterota bacterium]